MTGETVFVFALIGVAGLMMATNRVRFDVVALLVVLALMLSEVLTVEEALSGFGSPVVALVAGLLVLGEMLSRTGVARIMGDWVLRRGGQSEGRLLVLVMGGAALLGSVMSSTAVVALFIPVVLRVAAETSLNSSRMLIPLSYASLISGMMTLIATTPNIIVHEQLRSSGFDGYGFFSFTPVGLTVLAVCILYVLLIGRHILGPRVAEQSVRQRARSYEELWQEHAPGSTYQKLRIESRSPLAGQTISETRIESDYKVRIVGVLRRKRKGEERIVSPASATELAPGTVILVVGLSEGITRLVEDKDLTVLPPAKSDRARWLWDISAAAILVHPDSQLLGKSLRECAFQSQYGVHVLGMRRNFKAVEEYGSVSLNAADSLFVVGPWSKVQQLSQRSSDFVVTEYPREHADSVPSYHRMGRALMILGGMVVLTVLNIVPLVAAVGVAAIAAILTRCLTMEDAYRSIHWGSLVLIAGMLPLALALDKTGGTSVVVNALMMASGEAGPYVIMTLLFFLTAAIGLVLPNTASAVLVAPIAVYAASALGMSPYPFATTVVIAASSSFSTPVATPVVSLVVEPGRYVFTDFIKTGLPLLVLVYLTTLLVTPLVFPFHPG